MDDRFEAFLIECAEGIGENFIDVPEEMQIPHRFSRASRRKMRRMMRQQFGGFSILKVPYRRRKSFMITLTVLIFLSLITAAICAGRNMISGFYAEAFDDNILVWNAFEEDILRPITEVYMPTWLPEGFELISVDNDPKNMYYEYSYCSDSDCDHQDATKHIRFRQYVKGNYKNDFDYAKSDWTEITINDYRGIEVEFYEVHIFVWNIKDYTFVIEVSVDIDKSKAMAIAKSVEKVE